MQTMQDLEFFAEATKSLGRIDPASGTDMQQIVSRVYSLPARVVDKAREAIKP